MWHTHILREFNINYAALVRSLLGMKPEQENGHTKLEWSRLCHSIHVRTNPPDTTPLAKEKKIVPHAGN
jgi:hypothetical protein